MRRVLFGLIFAVVAGCGGSTGLHTRPLSDEEKAAVKAADRKVDDEEKAGSGKSTRKK